MRSIQEHAAKALKARSKGNRKATEKALRQARQAARKFSPEWVNISKALTLECFGRKRHAEAIKLGTELKAAWESGSITVTRQDQVQVLTMLGKSQHDVGNLEDAENLVTEAMRLDQSLFPSAYSAEHNGLLAHIRAKRKDISGAIEAYQNIIEKHLKDGALDDNLLMVVFAGVQVLEEAGKPDEALEFKRAVCERVISAHVASRSCQREPIRPPNGWGTDFFTDYLDNARTNEIVAMSTNQSYAENIRKMQARFDISKYLARWDLIRPIAKSRAKNPEASVAPDKDWLEMFFLMRCQASFLAAAREALAGHIPEAYMIMRSCIETALYAFHVTQRPDHKGLWFGRRNPQTRSQMNDVFSPTPIMTNELKPKDHVLSARTKELYDLTIDNGAHPNLETFLSHAKQVPQPTELVFMVAYQNPDKILPCLDDLLSVAECSLAIFKHVFPHAAF